MAQFYTKERSVGNATAKIYDDSQRILQQSEQLIESMRAVSSYEERQQATLINNLRAHRQKEKEENTRNHQLLMDNMKQVFEVQDQNNVNDLQRRKEKIEQEERTLETIANLSVTAAKTVGKIREGVVEEERQKALNDLHTGLSRTPEQYDSEIAGYEASQAAVEDVSAASAAAASLAKSQGEPRSFWSKLLVNDSQLQKIRYEVVVAEEGNKLIRGGLEDIIRNNPDEQVTIVDPNTQQEVSVRYGDISNVESSEALNRVYSSIAEKHLRNFMGEVDPIVFNKTYSKVRQYINKRTLEFSDKLDRDKIRENETLSIQKVLLGDTPSDVASAAIRYVQTAQISPHLDAGTALNVVTNQVLPNVDNPVAFAKEMGQMEFPHMPGTAIADTPFGKQLLTEAQRIQKQKDDNYLATENAQGVSIAKNIFKAGHSDNQLFDTSEYRAGYDAIREKETNGTITFEAARAAELELDNYYSNYNDSKLVREELREALEKQQLTPEMNTAAYVSGHTTYETWKANDETIASLSSVKLPNGTRYTKDNVRGYYYTTTSNKLGQFDVSGRAKHFSAALAADIAADLYVKRYKELLNDPKTNYTAAQAAEQAFNDIQAKIDNEEGVFFVDQTDSARGNIYSRLTPGNQTGAPRQVPIPSIGATEVGLALRGDGIAKLNDTDFPGLTTNYPVHRERIKAGLPLKPTAFEQAVADASGYSFATIFNKMAEANGDEERTEGGTYGVFTDQVPKENAELRRVLDSPKTWNKISSVVDRTDNVMPARMGNQALGFHNATSIARKLGNPNPEAIGALWYSQTGGGSNVGSGSPMQQIQQIIEDNPDLNMFIPYGELASSLPQVVPIMRQYGDSHNSISGTSKTIARLSNSMGPQNMRTGAAYMQQQLGFSPQGAAYLAGNIMQESSWDGKRSWGEVMGDGSQKNYGLPSWAEFPGERSRVKRVEDYLGKSIDQASHKEQLAAIKWELENYYPEAYNIFTDPAASEQQLRTASKQYLGYGHEGDRFKFANQLLNK